MDRLQHVSPLDHVHLLAETCPMCDQVIPNDRLADVQARHAEHERETVLARHTCSHRVDGLLAIHEEVATSC